MANGKDPSAGKTSGVRGDRLRAALRENLKRRKAQARGRGAPGEARPHDSAGIEPEIAPARPKG